jgi:glycosyltransferase involved in cell wall biosynthesis
VGVELIDKCLGINRKGLKIGIIGSCPPPFGGVTVHIQRLMKKLDDFNIDYVLYDVLGVQRENKENRIVCIKHPKLWIIKYFLLTNNEIIHNHTEDWRGQIIVGFMGLFGKKTITTLHSEKLINSWRDCNFIKRMAIQIALKSTTILIVVNSNIKEFCLSIGIHPNKIFLIPAFIPPVFEKEEINEIPREIWDFLDQHNPIISANAFKITIFKGEDVYGIELCMDLCYKLKQNWNNLGLMFFLPEIGDRQYFSYLQKRIIELKLQNNFLFVTQPVQMYPILWKSDIFVRPTITDGDSVSIREALYYGIPVVASDCVIRPKEVILFQNGNKEQFIEKVTEVLENYSKYKNLVDSIEIVDEAEKIIKIYSNLWGMKSIE